MIIPDLKRNPEAIHNAIDYRPDEHIMVAREAIKLHVPQSYLNGKLGSIDSRYNIIGYVAYIVGDSYAISQALAMMPFTPDDVTTIKYDEGTYYELSWEPGSTICPNTRLPQKATLAFEIYDEIVAKGKMPWYMNHRDRAEVFHSSKKFAGADLGGSPALMSIFCSSCARDPKDRSRSARETFVTQADYLKAPIDYIPLRSVAYGADNTASRLLGSYAKTGIAASLVNPSDSNEKIEELLRA